ncbi:twin-arginine translocation signal domain-containing protein [Fulvimarina sp. MAC3]|uniref:twin-arginine translocation signal domain-containing protein n=1 Tax=Fulvimarina sp. MAC3 TaxID=3148887 RepID=UPI0031FC56F9
MSGSKDNRKTDRRSFLKFAGVGGVATGAAALASSLGSAEAAGLDEEQRGDAGYKETAHVKTFYDTARF